MAIIRYNSGVISILIGMVLGAQEGQLPSAPQKEPTLVRHFVYFMTGTNKDRDATVHYQAQANGDEWQDPKGHVYDAFKWSGMQRDGKPITLPEQSSAFQQIVSLDPAYRAPYPDLSKVDPMLIGPITDLMTFFVDARLAMNLDLAGVGSHALVRYGRPSSWADGKRVILGQDAIDFDVTLKSVNRRTSVLNILVKHIPPTSQSLTLPADWMQKPIGDTPNNWVQVVKTPEGRYVAGVGKETFEVQVNVGLLDGRIESASEDNVVEVSECICSNEKLTDPSKPVRYRIVRHVEIRQ